MSEFERTVDELVDELRERLIRDAQARAAGEPIRGGVRRTWGEMVSVLVDLVPRSTMPADVETWPTVGRDQPGFAGGRRTRPGHDGAARAPRTGGL